MKFLLTPLRFHEREAGSCRNRNVFPFPFFRDPIQQWDTFILRYFSFIMIVVDTTSINHTMSPGNFQLIRDSFNASSFSIENRLAVRWINHSLPFATIKWVSIGIFLPENDVIVIIVKKGLHFNTTLRSIVPSNRVVSTISSRARLSLPKIWRNPVAGTVSKRLIPQSHKFLAHSTPSFGLQR